MYTRHESGDCRMWSNVKCRMWGSGEIHFLSYTPLLNTETVPLILWKSSCCTFAVAIVTLWPQRCVHAMPAFMILRPDTSQCIEPPTTATVLISVAWLHTLSEAKEHLGFWDTHAYIYTSSSSSLAHDNRQGLGANRGRRIIYSLYSIISNCGAGNYCYDCHHHQYHHHRLHHPLAVPLL